MSLKDIGKCRLVKWAEEVTGYEWAVITAFGSYLLAIFFLICIVFVASGCRSSIHANTCLALDCADQAYSVVPTKPKKSVKKTPAVAPPSPAENEVKKKPR